MNKPTIRQRIEQSRIIPVIALENPDDAVALCKALEAGGLKVAEITFRTAGAHDAIRSVAKEFPDFALGAGTVTTLEEVDAARDAGAQFAVAPGLNPRIVRHSEKHGLPFFPGIATPSDIEAALELGVSLLKFFPAGNLGGVKMIKSLYGPYRHRGIKFIPTGGVSASNLKEYLEEPAVAAVGGSWVVDKKLLAARDWDSVTKLTREAVEIAAQAGH